VVTVLVKKLTQDNAYVIEYIPTEETPTELFGQQMFTYAAAKELKLINSLPFDMIVFKIAYANA
jgi:hypothetical protein